LKELVRKAHAECGGGGVGVVGMCLTGGFALAMMTEPAVIAPVLSQPSLPFGNVNKSKIDATPDEIACAKRRFAEEDLSMIGLRFEGDLNVPKERFEMLRASFGDEFETYEIDVQGNQIAGPFRSHGPSRHKRPEGPTMRARNRIIAFFAERTDRNYSSRSVKPMRRVRR
jgi:dienelactone hydrolase